jgi:amino acid transporter
MIGVAWVVKMQAFLLFTLVLSMLMFVIGTFTKHDRETTGFTGYSGATFRDNFGPAEGFGVSKFFEVFGVFFPAVTGIMAGANISGDLRDPQRAIPKGTLLAIGISGVVYIALGWIIGAVVVRSAADGTAGLIEDYHVFQKVSAVEALVVVGIFAATLSSALASMVGGA